MTDTMNIAVVTTFPNDSWPIYSKQMLKSFVQYWPAEIPLMVQLDDDLLYDKVNSILRAQDGIAVGREDTHAAFVARNNHKDHPTDYRKQAVRFCHKVFAIKRALDAAMKQIAVDKSLAPRYLIWMDADVWTTRAVTLEDIKASLPKEGDAVAYLGRKDWDHSECGWLAFDLESGGAKIINYVVNLYSSDGVFIFDQWHDSWLWDQSFAWKDLARLATTNLTADKPGTEIWEQSPMASWSKHYKGPAAKQKLAMEKQSKMQPMPTGGIQIQTRNAIPNEEIWKHIERNQELITKWVKPCELNDEEIVVVSAGPMLVAEDVRKETSKIVAVKHALKPLSAAGIKPWACILLDPRPHLIDFVKNADKDVIWFVASQVNPSVTIDLLAQGCTVWGYHASVGANEAHLTDKQKYAVVSGGSATATRGLYLLKHIGFRKMKLYGYDLCYPDKPNLELKDDIGQPKYLEFSLGSNDPLYPIKRCFWSEPQLIAQVEEVSEMIKNKEFQLEAHGDGIVPFLLRTHNVANLRRAELIDKIVGEKPTSYKELLYGTRRRCKFTWPSRSSKSSAN